MAGGTVNVVGYMFEECGLVVLHIFKEGGSEFVKCK
jgi:hypothetical protein